MNIPEFSLPSNPSIRPRLREATTEEALEFSDVTEDMEESLTSLFLDKLQDKATWTDPKKWTGEDRRLALFWYWMHTAEDYKPALTFECSGCQKEHTLAVDLREIANGYIEIQGKAERDLEFEGGKIIVRPLSGEALEHIELVAIAGKELENKGGLDAQIRFLKFLHTVEYEGEKDQEKPLEYREKKLKSLYASQFRTLAGMVETALEDMKHGLPSEYIQGRIYLITPEVPCPEKKGKGGGTQLRLPFRNYDYVPRI